MLQLQFPQRQSPEMQLTRSRGSVRVLWTKSCSGNFIISDAVCSGRTAVGLFSWSTAITCLSSPLKLSQMFNIVSFPSKFMFSFTLSVMHFTTSIVVDGQIRHIITIETEVERRNNRTYVSMFSIDWKYCWSPKLVSGMSWLSNTLITATTECNRGQKSPMYNTCSASLPVVLTCHV